ncbi:MAG TPA: ectoine/hydroxyectoine ABC transporter permease subunit EhuC [Alphaproteobacteria bacterium]|nr:ectoine/hydroxyectoine ABC transporter permease subunit EhuC [Alphaproteobacteria bacterium]
MKLPVRSLAVCAILAFAAGLVVASFASFREFLPGLLEGSWVTIEITLGGCIIAVVMAVIAALLKLYGPWPLRWLAITYIEIFRGTSALVQLFWMFFVLPRFGITLAPLTVAILALGLNVGAYGAEVVRGAVLAVPRGQWEATVALNMSRLQALRRVVLPQAFVAMIPPWGNLFIELLKATALVSLITISDLAFKAEEMNSTTYKTIEIFSIVLVFYLALAMLITIAMRQLERVVARGLARGRSS